MSQQRQGVAVRGFGLTQGDGPARLVFLGDLLQHVGLAFIPVSYLRRRGIGARRGPDKAAHFFHYRHHDTASEVNI